MAAWGTGKQTEPPPWSRGLASCASFRIDSPDRLWSLALIRCTGDVDEFTPLHGDCSNLHARRGQQEGGQALIISRIRAGLGTILLPVTGVGAKSNADEWEELQSRGYHPELEVIIERYQRDIDVNDADGWVAFMGESSQHVHAGQEDGRVHLGFREV